MQSRRSFLPKLLAAGAFAAGFPPAVRGAAQPDRAMAPAFLGIDGWLNTTAPLALAGLRGKVVLVNFWTYSCINCRRTVPYLNRWQAEYGAVGLQVAGIHTPEFAFEHTRHNVADAVAEFGIHYPVGQDNAFQTWRAWSNQAWPAFYLLDRDGRIVLVREGEGHARELEAAIRALLGLAPSDGATEPGDDPDLSRIRTPEIYFGALHPTPQDRSQRPREGEAAYAFGPAVGPKANQYQLDGTAPQPTRLRVTVDGGVTRVHLPATCGSQAGRKPSCRNLKSAPVWSLVAPLWRECRALWEEDALLKSY